MTRTVAAMTQTGAPGVTLTVVTKVTSQRTFPVFCSAGQADIRRDSACRISGGGGDAARPVSTTVTLSELREPEVQLAILAGYAARPICAIAHGFSARGQRAHVYFQLAVCTPEWRDDGPAPGRHRRRAEHRSVGQFDF